MVSIALEGVPREAKAFPTEIPEKGSEGFCSLEG